MAAKMSVDGLKKWALGNKRLSLAVLKTQAFAEATRERVDAYIGPIFVAFKFTDLDGKPIDSQDRLYQAFFGTGLDGKHTFEPDNEAVKEKTNAYYAACNVEHRKHGYRGQEGNCPVLEAEGLLTDAEEVFLKSGKDFLGIDVSYVSGSNRKKLLDLLHGACLAALTAEDRKELQTDPFGLKRNGYAHIPGVDGSVRIGKTVAEEAR